MRQQLEMRTSLESFLRVLGVLGWSPLQPKVHGRQGPSHSLAVVNQSAVHPAPQPDALVSWA